MNQKTATLRRALFSVLLALTLVLGSILILGSGTPAMAAVKKPTLSKATASLKVGKTVTLKVKKGSSAIKKTVWSSNKESVAVVTKKGKVTAKKTGNAVITAKVTTADKKKYTLKCKVKVTAAKKAYDLDAINAANQISRLLKAHGNVSITQKYSNSSALGDTTVYFSNDVISMSENGADFYYTDGVVYSRRQDVVYGAFYLDEKDYQRAFEATLTNLQDQIFTMGSGEKVVNSVSKSGKLTLTTQYSEADDVQLVYDTLGLTYTKTSKLYAVYVFDAKSLEIKSAALGTDQAVKSPLMKLSFQYGIEFREKDSAFADVFSARKRDVTITYAKGTSDELSKSFSIPKGVGLNVWCAGGFDTECYTDESYSTLFAGSAADDYSALALYIPQLRTATESDETTFRELVAANTMEETLKRHTSRQVIAEAYDPAGGLLNTWMTYGDADKYAVEDSNGYESYITKEHYVDRYGDDTYPFETLFEDADGNEKAFAGLLESFQITVPTTEVLTQARETASRYLYYTQLKDRKGVETVLERIRMENGQDIAYESGIYVQYSYAFDKNTKDALSVHCTLNFANGYAYNYAYETWSYDTTYDKPADSLKDYFSQTENRTVTLHYDADDSARAHERTFQVPKGVGIDFRLSDTSTIAYIESLYTDSSFTKKYARTEDTMTDDLELYIRSDGK